MAEEKDDAPKFDAARLMADLRGGDPEAVALAFNTVFDTGLGRLVLGLHLMDCGVGNIIGKPGMTHDELAYAVGRHDAAVALASRVFDPAALVVATFTGELEGSYAPEPNFEGEFLSNRGVVGDLGDDG